MVDMKVWAAKVERLIDGQVRAADQSMLRDGIIALMRDAYDEAIANCVTVQEKRQLVARFWVANSPIEEAIDRAGQLIERVK